MSEKELIAHRAVAAARLIAVSLVCLFLFRPGALAAAAEEVQWSDAQKPLSAKIGELRDMPEEARAKATAELALKVRQLPAAPNKLRLALYLGQLSTEGDLGHGTIQEVATTLAQSLREKPLPWTALQESDTGKFRSALLPAYGYRELATLVRYEHVNAALPADAHYRAALDTLAEHDRKRQQADFALTDLSGKTWHLSQLHGKVVLVNFWATWCPPCRQEIPALGDLYSRLGSEGLLVLGISDEDASKLEPFALRLKMPYPILRDPDGAAKKAFDVEGIPKSFLYDKSGRLVAQAMDARSPRQFQEMLQKAGVK